MNYNMQKKMIIGTFLVVPIGLLLLLMFYPSTRLFYLSMTDWDGYAKDIRFVGLDNYKKLILDSKDLWTTLRNNAYYFVIHLIAIPFEIMVASVLTSKLKGSRFFKSVTFMPYVINAVAVALMFSYFYSPNGGGLNSLLDATNLGFLKQKWLSDLKIVNFSLVTVSLWRFCGQHVILFIAGVQSVSKDYYEAAEIDGASKYQQFVHITVPGIKTVIELVLFLNIRGALTIFEVPFLMTNGGPGYQTSTFMVYTIKTAFQFNQFGLASAMAVLTMVLIIGGSWLQTKIIKIRD